MLLLTNKVIVHCSCHDVNTRPRVSPVAGVTSERNDRDDLVQAEVHIHWLILSNSCQNGQKCRSSKGWKYPRPDVFASCGGSCNLTGVPASLVYSASSERLRRSRQSADVGTRLFPSRTNALSSQDVPELRQLRGNALAKRLRAEIAAAKEQLLQHSGSTPVLVTLLVGTSPPALAYRSSIDRTFRKVEIEHRHIELAESISNEDLIAEIERINADESITGVLVLMPLPDHLDPHVILEHLSPLKDVDGITPTNAGRLHLGLPSLRPSTPAGGIELLDFFDIDLDGAAITVIGRSNVVGRPLATLLTQRHATVTLCHTHTRDLGNETRPADIVCVAAGYPGLVTGDMLKPGAIVLDFGVNVTDEGKIVGDADAASLKGIAAAYTPVPGGTGPVTALVLARNVLAAGYATLEGSLDAVLYELPEALLLSKQEELAAK